nr:hypothetical protein [Tanacetum cinerariifolium]
DTEQVISAAADEVSTCDAVNTAGTEVNTTSAPVTTAGIFVSTAKPNTPPITTTTTTMIKDEDLTIAQTLVKMRSEKSKARGVVMKEPSETATRPTLPPQKHDPKDKELHVKLEEEERAKEREENTNIAEWDDVQAMIDVDYKLAERLQEKERGELTVEENSRLFLKNKSFDEVQKVLDKTMSWIDSFVSMDTKVVKDKAEGSKIKVEGSSMRAGEDLQQEYQETKDG